jgi:hypothetical protein
MSDLSSTSYCKDNSCDNGMSPLLMIFLLLFLCGGSNGILGGCNSNGGCGICGSGGMDGMLPLLLILLLSGGSF